MKRTYICASLFALLTFTSCSNYLKSDSADLLIPTSVSDYIPVFRGEAYPTYFNSQIGFVHLMTDDVEMGPLYYDATQKSDRYCKTWATGIDQNAEYGEGAYVWRADYSSDLVDGFWAGRYKNIMGCNTIINALPEMTYSDSEKGQYRALAAQAYAMRAYHYFCLINTYALPWSKENLNQPGVLLKLTPDIQVTPQARATIGEVYAQINSDIKMAQEYMDGADFQNEKLSGVKSELSSAAIYFLAARIALYQEDWDEVIAASEKFLAKNSSIYDLNEKNVDGKKYFGYLRSYVDSEDRSAIYVANRQEYDEVVFGFGSKDGRDFPYLAPYSPTLMHYEYGFHTSWEGDNSLLSQYEDDDLRLQAYFESRYDKTGTKRSPVYYAGQARPHKYETSFDNCYSQAWRVPEVILDMAEAYARKESGVSSKAIEYLNQLRVKKFKTGSTTAEKQVSDFADQDALIKFVWAERRRELCFDELIRFWDLRREGMPAQEHRLYTSSTDYTTYKLPQGSANYVLPIPSDETAYNSAIVNNQREVIGASESGSME